MRRLLPNHPDYAEINYLTHYLAVLMNPTVHFDLSSELDDAFVENWKLQVAAGKIMDRLSELIEEPLDVGVWADSINNLHD